MEDFNYQNNFENNEQPIEQVLVTDIKESPSQELQQSPTKEKKFSIATVIVSSILSIIISLGAAFGAFYYMYNQGYFDSQSPKQTNNSATKVNIKVDKESVSVVEAVAEKVIPSVVGIRTTISYESFFGDQESSGEGSGVIYREDGYIITNYHVISDALNNKEGKIEVFLESIDAEPKIAEVVGYNISADIAVIKVDAKNLPAIEVADSKNLQAGQFVITVGNPGGLEFMDSVTYGVISGLDRKVSSDSTVSLIQTDAAINPGNSGGALVNVNGELVGINSSKIVAEEFEGMGFAVPSNTVVEICEDIIENENSPEPYLGISISEKYTSEILDYYGYPNGAVVSSVAEGSPAYKAGIRRGDIITEFNNVSIEEYSDLSKLLSQCKPGDNVPLEVYRNGRRYSASIVIGSNNQVG